MPDKLILLDSEQASKSLSIAEARHVARDRVLDILDALLEMGMNIENKVADRRACLRDVLDFAEGAEGTEGKLAARLRPEVARRLARLGKEQDDAKTRGKELTDGQVVSPDEEG